MKFTESHEWVKIEEENKAVIGVSQFAQRELGDIVYVELPMVGKTVKAGQEIAVLESTKAAADVYSPLSGIIIEINQELIESPALINQDPEGRGWIVKVEVSELSDLEALMDKNTYQEILH